MSTANDLTHQAREEFLDRNRNLLALTKAGANDVFKSISASLALDQKAQDDVFFYLDVIDQKDMSARSVAREDFRRDMYRQICRSFLRVFRNARVEFVVKSFTPEAQAEFMAIEIAAGERAPVPPPPPVKSQAELLEEQVRDDWRKLPTDKLKVKLNSNREYKATFDRLMAANQLESVATSYHDNGKEFRS